MIIQTLRKNNVSDDLYLVYCFLPKPEACNVDAFGEEDPKGKFIGKSKKKLWGKMIKRKGVFCGTYYHSVDWYEDLRETGIRLFGKTELPEVTK